jgi:putative Mg2+ transporter-C (MgtC) family protein
MPTVIWMTAAIGVTVGLGGLGLALISTLMTWIVLSALRRLELGTEMKRLKTEDLETPDQRRKIDEMSN